MKIKLVDLGLESNNNLGNEMWMNGHCCSGYPNCIHKPNEKKELNDCPFCGSKGIIKEYGLDGWRGRCSKGCCTTGDSTMDKRQVIKSWNTRTAENEKSVLVIDEEKLAAYLFEENQNNLYGKDALTWEVALEYEKEKDATCHSFREKAKHLSQKVKSFMRIEKE